MPHCSFCGSPSHTIRTCNSESVTTIYTYIIGIYDDYKYYGSNNNTGNPVLALALTVTFQLTDLKAVCIRYLGCNFRNKSNCVKALIDYFYRVMPPNTIYVPAPPLRLNMPIPIPISIPAPAHKIEICQVIIKGRTKNSKTHECDICFEFTKPSDFIKLNCSHKFCKSCIKSIITTHSPRQFTPEYAPKCALCRSQITLLTAEISAYDLLVGSTYNFVKLVE